MKIFILTRKRLIIIFSSLLSSALVFVLFLGGTFPFAAEERKLPIYRVETDKKMVSLSFDAAWGNEQTSEILNVLDSHDVKSTFFLVGFWADKYPESVKEISDRGHDVANHSNTHPHLTKMKCEEIKKQIDDCNNKIEKIIGKKPILFRPPYGDYNNDVVEKTNELNMHCIQWNIDSLDWKDYNCKKMKKRIIPKLKPGSIILMHNGAKYTPSSLPEIITSIKEKGYEIVPISEIIYKENYTIGHDGAQIQNKNEANKINETNKI
ncbi:MAG: polysaccharide deacetylase family protein [Oscillospiraceae bacterium]|jgi:polysaccharide deacetylase family sporulation protein PdaB|nr:polysaccharide deacetylase family protein [Oscillospiraceae bacterium]